MDQSPSGRHLPALELHHVAVVKERGVAVLQRAAKTMEEARPSFHGNSGSRRWCAHINRRQMFGIALLIVVDLIWVGSAGLTRYLFHDQSYNKPFFTVYFKTVLFSIYLLPFLFWRPWQRLCCCIGVVSCTKRRRKLTSSNEQGGDNEMGDDDVFEDFQKHQQHSKVSRHTKANLIKSNSEITSSTESLSASGSYKLPMLGPSIYRPLRCNGVDETELPHNSLTLPKPPPSLVLQQEAHITASDTYLKRKRLSRVRFSRTVEVKHVPSVSEDGSVSSSPTVKDKPLASLTVRQVLVLSLPFGLLWFFANYLYALALDEQSVAIVNALSSLSGVFVLVLAALPLPKLSSKDKFTLTKLIIIMISVGGAVLIGISKDGHSKNLVHFGSLYAVGGAGLYACYLVLLSKSVPDEDALEIPMFFGFVGVFVTVLIAPLLAFWHYVNWEELELPPTNMVWTLLLINGFVGTVLSELLWLWGCLLTSSLVGTLSLSLVTPLSITYSIVTKEISITITFACGAVLTIVAFIMVAVVNHWSGWDPVWLLIKRLVFRSHRFQSQYHGLSSESKSLLDKQEETISNADSINFIPDQ